MFLSILLIGILAQAQPGADASAKYSVEGKIFNAITGEPLRKASVVLRGAEAGNTGVNLTATTDAGGAYAIQDVPPGKYRMIAQHPGFQTQPYGARQAGRGGAMLTLAASAKDLAIRMWPDAVITGRITDADGDPIPFATVSLQKTVWTAGQKRLQNASSASTNDLGEYRLFGVPAGRYVEQIAIRNMEIPTGPPSGNEDYAPTYYPGVSDARTAVTLEVSPGQTLQGVNVTALKIPTRRVRGKIISLVPAQRGQTISLMVLPKDYGFSPAKVVMVPFEKGTFDMRLPPGAWNFMASQGMNGENATARVAVDVGNADLENVTITIQQPGEIKGHIRIDGASDLQALGKSTVRVSAQPREFGVNPNRVGMTAVDADGAFTLKGVGPEPLDVFITTGVPPGFYTKSVTYGRQDVKANGLSYAGSAETLEIVLSPNAATLSGVVRNKSGEPAVGATAVLIPPVEKRGNARRYRIAPTDTAGRFEMTSLEPGKYSVFAWEDMEPGAYFDPDFLRPVEQRGKAVELKESARDAVELEAIPAEDSPAARQ